MALSNTLADEQFERFCDLRRIKWRRISPAQKEGHKRPDYAIWVDGTGCVAEVKQLDLNEQVLRQQEELNSQGFAGWKETQPGRRVRGKIGEAAGQLRPFVRRGISGILVLFDRTRSLHHLDPYNVMTGMHGLDAQEIELENGHAGGWHASRWKSGGKEKITPTTNTSISALAALHIGPDRAPYLVLYHNEVAAVPLDASCVAGATDHQFVHEVRRPENVNVWRHAITGEVLT